MERLGRWPVSLWCENPLFCCGSDCVALAHDGGVCVLICDRCNAETSIPADRKLDGKYISRPALLDDGRIALFQGFNRWCSRCSLCTTDLNGHVIESHTVPEGYSCCDCDTVEVSGRYIALCHKISGGVTIYNQADLSLVGQISDLELRQGSEGNPPADLLFISNEELFVGTWERLFLYRMIPEKPDCKPAQRL